jgi:hypothetical protein
MKIPRWRSTLRGWLIAVALLGVIAALTRSLLPEPPAPRLSEGARLFVPAVVGMRTAVARLHKAPPPWPTGNCFELPTRAQDRRGPPQGLHVIDMHAENFEEVVKRLGLTSVEVEILGGQFLVVDPRIARRWLRETPCSTCSGIGEAIPPKYADRFSEPAPRP